MHEQAPRTPCALHALLLLLNVVNTVRCWLATAAQHIRVIKDRPFSAQMVRVPESDFGQNPFLGWLNNRLQQAKS